MGSESEWPRWAQEYHWKKERQKYLNYWKLWKGRKINSRVASHKTDVFPRCNYKLSPSPTNLNIDLNIGLVFLNQICVCVCVCVCVSVCVYVQLCLTLRDPMDCSLPGFSISGTIQARILEGITISSKSYSTINLFLLLLHFNKIFGPT